MRKIIGGKVYDTKTAAYVCDVSGPHQDRSNFRYDSTGLYKSPKGTFFIAGHGGALSRWAQSTGQNSWTGGEGLRLVTEEDAREMFSEHGSADDYEEFFGAPEEG